MTRRGRVPKKHRKPTPQHTPTLAELVDRYNHGLRSPREIANRVKAGLPNKVDAATKTAFASLQAIAQQKGWVSA